MTVIEEILSAGRGVLAIILGRRDAPTYFDLTLKGLVGSFIAFLVVTTLTSYLPLSGAETERGLSPGRGLIFTALLYALQIGLTALVLRQLGRLDGLVPYIVADNWASVYAAVAVVVLGLLGFNSDLLLMITAIVALIIIINVARLVLTLAPMQIAMLIVAQLVGTTIGLMVLTALLNPQPMAAPA